MATQGERRTATREALLGAAAHLFAEHGVDHASVDAIAREAGRTSGALYDHFGSKEGLLFALLESWVDDVAVVIAAELVNASTRSERVAALWHNFADPAVGDGRWVALEHELWTFAARNPAARERLAARYRDAFALIDADPLWAEPTATPAPSDATVPTSIPSVGAVLVGVLLGLEMVRRIDPRAITDDTAIATLCRVLDATDDLHTDFEPSDQGATT